MSAGMDADLLMGAALLRTLGLLDLVLFWILELGDIFEVVVIVKLRLWMVGAMLNAVIGCVMELVETFGQMVWYKWLPDTIRMLWYMMMLGISIFCYDELSQAGLQVRTRIYIFTGIGDIPCHALADYTHQLTAVAILIATPSFGAESRDVTLELRWHQRHGLMDGVAPDMAQDNSIMTGAETCEHGCHSLRKVWNKLLCDSNRCRYSARWCKAQNCYCQT
jgi:hypothetical protein